MNHEPNRSQESEMLIGSCKYIVTTHFKGNARETAEDKLLQYVASCISAEDNGAENGII
jgi:hypothetical protein